MGPDTFPLAHVFYLPYLYWMFFFAYVDDLWDPWCFTLQLTPRFAFLQRCPPGILQVSSRNGYFLQNRHMNSDDFHHGNSWDWVRCSAQKIPKVVLACQSTSAYRESPRGPKDPKIPMIHGIVPCEAQIRPRAFPAARIRKRRPSATASKNARRPRRCRSCWRTTNELLVLYIYILLLFYIRYIYIYILLLYIYKIFIYISLYIYIYIYNMIYIYI